MDLYCDYDENLSQNAFFRKLQSDHKIIIDTAPLENWVICIPRSATIHPGHLTNADFLLAHVLIPNEELPQTHFTSLSGVEVHLEQKRLHVAQKQKHHDATAEGRETPTSGEESSEETPQDPIESLVLFEEVFYTKQLLKYKVWCIETPLIHRHEPHSIPGSASPSAPTPPGIYVVRDAKDAVEILWNETHSDAIFRKIDAACARFCKDISAPPVGTSINRTPASPPCLASLRENVEALYGQCMQTLVANRPLKEKCRADLHFFKIIRIALETYIMNGINETVFDQIALATREDGERFNGAVRCLADANVAYFGVNAKHMDVVACVRTELLRIEEYGTAIEKLGKIDIIFVCIYKNQYKSFLSLALIIDCDRLAHFAILLFIFIYISSKISVNLVLCLWKSQPWICKDLTFFFPLIEIVEKKHSSFKSIFLYFL